MAHEDLAVYSSVFAVGFIGNILYIAIVIKYEAMRTSMNILLTNLAVSDSLILTICCSVAISLTITGGNVWVFGAFLCKIYKYMEGVLTTCAIMTILTITYQRYQAVKKTYRYQVTCRFTIKMIVLIWACCLISMTPYLLLYEEQDILSENSTEYKCQCLLVLTTNESFYDAKSLKESWQIAYSITFYFIPITIICILYGQTVKNLVGKINLPHVTTNSHKKSTNIISSCILSRGRRRNALISSAQTNKERVVLMVTIVIILIICCTPFHLLLIAQNLTHGYFLKAMDDKTKISLAAVCRVLYFTNSAINPFIYTITSKHVRQHFCKMFNISTKSERANSRLRAIFRHNLNPRSRSTRLLSRITAATSRVTEGSRLAVATSSHQPYGVVKKDCESVSQEKKSKNNVKLRDSDDISVDPSEKEYLIIVMNVNDNEQLQRSDTSERTVIFHATKV